MRFLFALAIRIRHFFKRLQHDLRVWAYRRAGAQIGCNVRLHGSLDGTNPQLVRIGDNTVIGTGAHLIAHCPVRGALGVTVGKNCFVGYGAIVLAGVTIGDGCIIGAGSVVTCDIPAGSIAAGNPARVLRPRDPEELARTAAQVARGEPIGAAEPPQTSG